ncbi:MAG: radical SAM protein [Defluviitaleaceae bacterium]|nr:radical SAM protein [Defluviitaleaceae bacterium]
MKAKLSDYMNLNRIEFIVTWQCGGSCKHCQIGGEINKRGAYPHVLADYAVDAVKKLSTSYNITSVMTFGGEPLYYPEATAAIHHTATECGIGTRQVITNGYFTKSAEHSAGVAALLAEAGVNNLLLSVDAFHQEHIPIEPVYRFAEDIIAAKIPGARLYPAWLMDERHENPYNARTKEILARFADLPIAVGKGNNIFPGGNAARYLREYYEMTELNLSQSCSSTPYSKPLNDITTISIVPNGNVMICGFVIGNIYREGILDVVARYDPYSDVCMRAVMSDGVAGLLSLAKINGVEIDISPYLNACDVCHEIAGRMPARG